ncbi:MAG: UDP-N-acetylmuramate dehydrogenase [Patescibacteria group bacterium]
MKIEEKVSLARFSNYKTGGSADCFVVAKNLDELKSALVWAAKNQLNFFVLGGGTNVLFSDSGFRGLVIKIDNADFTFPKSDFGHRSRTSVQAGAGVLMPDLVAAAVDRGLTGLEWAGGLPGTLGGAVRGNAGCFGGEIKDAVVSVSALDQSGRLVNFNNRDCGFAYRHSRFKSEKLVVVEAVLKLRRDLPRERLAEMVQSRIDYRTQRQPLDWPNCGSVFKNVPLEKAPVGIAEKFKAVVKTDPCPIIPTAALIHEAGLKGFRIGGAQVSEKHPNFIINAGGARSADILELLGLVRTRIKELFDVDLEVEIELVGFD